MEDEKLNKNIEKAAENISGKEKDVKIEDITESLDNSPIWPAQSEEIKETGKENCRDKK